MNEDMRTVCDVKEKVMDLLDQANKQKDFSMSDVDWLYKATKTVKNSMEIEDMMEDMEGGYSSRGRDRMGRYSRNDGRDGYSREGDYSRDGRDGMMHDGGYSSRRRDGRGRYSRDGARSKMMEHLEMALDTATAEDREAIKRFMREIEKA